MRILIQNDNPLIRNATNTKLEGKINQRFFKTEELQHSQ